MGVRAPIGWPGFIFAVCAGGAGLAYYLNEKEAKKAASSGKEVKSFGRPALGGPWSLVDQNGVPTTDADLHGSFVLLYFGFTHCPDICPAELVKMGGILDAVAADPTFGTKAVGAGNARALKPAMITIDPHRDTCAQMKHYLQDFHPDFVGLTGTPAQVKGATKAFRVFFRETQPDRDPDDDEYLVDHSIVIYLLGPDGVFVDFFTQSVTAEEAAKKVLKHMAAEAGGEAYSGSPVGADDPPAVAEKQQSNEADKAASIMRRISRHEFVGSK